MKEYTLYGWIAQITVLVGGIVMGLFGLFGVNIFTGIFGNFLGRVLCIVIGVAAGYLCYLVYLDKMKKA